MIDLDRLNHISFALTWLCLIGIGALLAAAGWITRWLGRRDQQRRRP